MVNAVPATDGKSYLYWGAYQSSPNNLTHIQRPLLWRKVEILDVDVNTTDSAGTLLELFAQAKNDYLCEYT